MLTISGTETWLRSCSGNEICRKAELNLHEVKVYKKC